MHRLLYPQCTPSRASPTVTRVPSEADEGRGGKEAGEMEKKEKDANNGGYIDGFIIMEKVTCYNICVNILPHSCMCVFKNGPIEKY